uniref:Uncharacterized protein n=1 Tax=Chromera velia CCMP2878 TaxID=1169474 RepID=A0A0G4G051_9ALVE|eukprot:Cvel_19495.t1-p1 / transcript=Cvel_19495.t1 / gene=Cvel_19495 / organism=Chromera_velia_CCMP2878 / gene_product=hypothetical protein / transcript_product=hypothetical protein / location=Cvel_scaffold1685:35811-40702(-) / protein_length=94 / sequence_SO=supercontig / SO=protein_coding / is_pseudo=false
MNRHGSPPLQEPIADFVALGLPLTSTSRGVGDGFAQKDLGRGVPAVAKLGQRRRTVIHCGESGREAARPFPCSTGGDRLFTILTEPVVSIGAVM